MNQYFMKKICNRIKTFNIILFATSDNNPSPALKEKIESFRPQNLSHWRN